MKVYGEKIGMRTVDDLMKVLEFYDSNFPEFRKFNLCMDVAPDYVEKPDLRDVNLYINTDIGQVEIYAKMD